MIFGSGEEQPWNRPLKSGNDDSRIEDQPLNKMSKNDDQNHR